MLVIIGRNWISPKLSDPNDVLRNEVESALAQGIHIIPVLVHGATLPEPSQLPDSLVALASYQAFELNTGRFFKRDMEYLVTKVKPLLSSKRSPKVVATRPLNTPNTQLAGGNRENTTPPVKNATSVGRPRVFQRKLLTISLILVLLATIAISMARMFGSDERQIKYLIDNEGLMSISSGNDTTKEIRFFDNSTVRLMNNTSANIKHATNEKVFLKLNQGELFLDAKGAETKSWIVGAGEYVVSLVSPKSRFYVKWNGSLLDVRVVRGNSLVEGLYAGKSGIVVHRNSHLRLDAKTGFFALNNMSSPFYDASSPSLLRNEQEMLISWNKRLAH